MKFLILIFLWSCQSIPSNPRVILHSSKIYSAEKGFLAQSFIIINKKSGKILDLSDSYTPQKNDEYYDFKDQVILPGFIDAHTHLFLTDKSFDKDFGAELIEQSLASLHVRENLAIKRAKALLRSGFTSVKDLGNSGMFYDEKLSSKFKDSADLPRIFFSGPGICILNCQFGESAKKEDVLKEYFSIQNFNEAKVAIDKVVSKKAHFLKVYADNIPAQGQMSDELFGQIVNYANSNNIKVAVHAISSEAVEMSSRYKIHSIEHASEINKKALQNIKLNNILITPTDLGFEEQIKVIKAQGIQEREKIKSEYLYHYNRHKKRVQDLLVNNISISFGSDFYFPVKNVKRDYMNSIWNGVKNFEKYGLEIPQIVSILTLGGAKAIGKSKELGDIKKNYIADLVVLKSNKLTKVKDLTSVDTVFKNGQRVE